nr:MULTISPECIES: tyrosine-type recombinase/integrase [unclassified Phaeobacter]
MRLAEAAGLLREDIFQDEDGQWVARIVPHPWRSLKTESSKRLVPLVGSAQWAAERAHAQSAGSKFAFPRYNTTGKTNANSASAALNKWLKAYVPEGATMHSFRHSMRDRLRAVECPSDIADQIGGWQSDGVGQKYEQGYPLQILLGWLQRVALPSASRRAIQLGSERGELWFLEVKSNVSVVQCTNGGKLNSRLETRIVMSAVSAGKHLTAGMHQESRPTSWLVGPTVARFNGRAVQLVLHLALSSAKADAKQCFREVKWCPGAGLRPCLIRFETRYRHRQQGKHQRYQPRRDGVNMHKLFYGLDPTCSRAELR